MAKRVIGLQRERFPDRVDGIVELPALRSAEPRLFQART
jgi:hypothetical protein